MDYQQFLNEIENKITPSELDGEVASYIPELAKIDPNKFGLHLCSIEGGSFGFGDCKEKFSIQSISKVLSLALALNQVGEELWERVSVEPSGSPFNSIVQLEYENGIPRNPLINPGALVICDILIDSLRDAEIEYLDFVRKIADNDEINYDKKVANSELLHGHHNRALINLMKGYGNIHNDVEEVLNFYFHTCSISMSCEELSKTFTLFANHGKLLSSDEQIISSKRAKRINALMQTCGFYDEAGEFSFRVGLPGKSGVGGGIVAVYPEKYSVAVWNPKLNKKGNSVAGIQALELLTDLTGSSIF